MWMQSSSTSARGKEYHWRSQGNVIYSTVLDYYHDYAIKQRAKLNVFFEEKHSTEEFNEVVRQREINGLRCCCWIVIWYLRNFQKLFSGVSLFSSLIWNQMPTSLHPDLSVFLFILTSLSIFSSLQHFVSWWNSRWRQLPDQYGGNHHSMHLLLFPVMIHLFI